jgi:hypothetical protein
MGIWLSSVADGKASDDAWGYGCLVVIGLAIFGVIQGCKGIGGEQEGFIKTDDCRRTVMVKEGSTETWFKKFTCMYRKTHQGVTMGGTCVAVDTDGAVCQTVYMYQKQLKNAGCMDPNTPYLGEDDMCHTTPQ